MAFFTSVMLKNMDTEEMYKHNLIIYKVSDIKKLKESLWEENYPTKFRSTFREKYIIYGFTS